MAVSTPLPFKPTCKHELSTGISGNISRGVYEEELRSEQTICCHLLKSTNLMCFKDMLACVLTRYEIQSSPLSVS